MFICNSKAHLPANISSYLLAAVILLSGCASNVQTPYGSVPCYSEYCKARVERLNEEINAARQAEIDSSAPTDSDVNPLPAAPNSVTNLAPESRGPIEFQIGLLDEAKINNIAPVQIIREPGGNLSFLGLNLNSLEMDESFSGAQIIKVAYETNPRQPRGSANYDMAYNCAERMFIDLKTNTTGKIAEYSPETKLGGKNLHSVAYDILCEGVDPYNEQEWQLYQNQISIDTDATSRERPLKLDDKKSYPAKS